jgi:sortase A
MSEELPERHRARRPAIGDRRRVSVVGVLGELLLTAGVLILLFLGWQLWWNDAIMAGQQSTAASDLSAQWVEEARADRGEEPAPAPEEYGEPLVGPESYPDGEPFAVMYVPRFGEDSQRRIAEGIGLDVLNSTYLGVGHYPDTQMPGQVGNFAIASHRSAYGGGMHEIEQLQLGDAIYIQTEGGWYTYRFRDFEYVTPETVDVLAPVPHHPELQPADRIVTLTSCNPLYSTAERIIAYGVLESWQPAAAGPPADIADIVATWGA